MKLIGRYGSPFVRRVGISMHAQAIPYQLVELAPFTQADDVRRFAAIGRVPILVLDDGESLIESGAILDYLDDRAGADKALLPKSGEARQRSLRIIATATAACDKAVAISLERRRPTEKIYDGWIAWCREQLDAALRELEAMRAKNWPKLDRLMQPEITTASMLAYVRRVEPDALAIGRFPQLESLSADCESTAEFRACPLG